MVVPDVQDLLSDVGHPSRNATVHIFSPPIGGEPSKASLKLVTWDKVGGSAILNAFPCHMIGISLEKATPRATEVGVLRCHLRSSQFADFHLMEPGWANHSSN